MKLNEAEHSEAAGCIPVVADFVRRLGLRVAQFERDRAPIPNLSQHGVELTLAEALFRYQVAPRGGRPVQLAVLGPTQTGKSTLVNLLLGQDLAQPSPLAGFTVHAHGFACGVGGGEWESALLPGWTRVESGALDRATLGAFNLTELPGPCPIGPVVVWDTPDFDSLAAQDYQKSVLEVAALADVVLMALSKEKYADRSAWRMLHLLAPLRRPTIVCLNKLTPDSWEAVQSAMRSRLEEAGGALSQTPVVPLPQRAGGLLDAEDARALREVAREACEGVDSSTARLGVREFVHAHWEEWTAPLKAEHDAADRWQAEVAKALDDLLADYRRDFLDHPQRFDTFRRAMVSLLDLLELPGLGGALGAARQVVTWPARRLLSAVRSWRQQRTNGDTPRGLGSEEQTLNDGIERLLTRLSREAARAADQAREGAAVWRGISRRLDEERGVLKQSFRLAAQRSQAEFEPQVQAAADDLYEALRERPALLNGLRAARATTDLASILLAVKSGGMHLNDVLFAPALFALNSALAEGALGTYMLGIAGHLKERQFEHVRQGLIERELRPALVEILQSARDDGAFGVSVEELGRATRCLAEWGRDGA